LCRRGHNSVAIAGALVDGLDCLKQSQGGRSIARSPNCTVDHNSGQVAPLLVERVGDFATSASGDEVLFAQPQEEVEEAVIGCLVLKKT
jgi:hypothetical protein